MLIRRSSRLVVFGALLSLAGCGGSTDPKDVALNPQHYAGKTLRSRVKLQEQPWAESGAEFR